MGKKKKAAIQVFLVCSVTRRLCCLSIQRNLDITKFSVQGTILLTPYLRYNNKIYEKEPRYNETSLQRTNNDNTITSVLLPILLARQNGRTFSSFLLQNFC